MGQARSEERNNFLHIYRKVLINIPESSVDRLSQPDSGRPVISVHLKIIVFSKAQVATIHQTSKAKHVR
jgi:hypothetical protein